MQIFGLNTYQKSLELIKKFEIETYIKEIYKKLGKDL